MKNLQVDSVANKLMANNVIAWVPVVHWRATWRDHGHPYDIWSWEIDKKELEDGGQCTPCRSEILVLFFPLVLDQIIKWRITG